MVCYILSLSIDISFSFLKKTAHRWRFNLLFFSIKLVHSFPNCSRSVVYNIIALILTSISMGNKMPKKSTAVNNSLAKSDQCLEIFPISIQSEVKILNSTPLPHNDHVQNGPSLRKTVSPFSSLIDKYG